MNSNVKNINNALCLSGEINFKTVPAIWQKSLAILDNNQIKQIDFSTVISASSAVLALMIEFIRYNSNNKNQSTLKLVGLSDQIKLIAETAGIGELLKKYM